MKARIFVIFELLCPLISPSSGVLFSDPAKKPNGLFSFFHSLVLTDSEKRKFVSIDSAALSVAINKTTALRFAQRYASPISKEGKPLITLVAADRTYKAAVLNWMLETEEHGITNYGIICLDNDIQGFMRAIGRPCFGDEKFFTALHSEDVEDYEGRMYRFWALRLQLVTLLTQSGIDVILTDADAIWVKNPFDLTVEGDITASRGGYPQDLGHRWGATAMMGFVYFHGTPAVAQFLKEEVIPRYMTNMEKPYDQVALNMAFAANNVTWSEKKMSYTKSTEISEGTVSGLRLRLLDHERFVRQCGSAKKDKANAYVLHCLVPTPEKKIMKTEFWRLRADWSTVPMPANATAPDAFKNYFSELAK